MSLGLRSKFDQAKAFAAKCHGCWAHTSDCLEARKGHNVFMLLRDKPAGAQSCGVEHVVCGISAKLRDRHRTREKRNIDQESRTQTYSNHCLLALARRIDAYSMSFACFCRPTLVFTCMLGPWWLRCCACVDIVELPMHLRCVNS